MPETLTKTQPNRAWYLRGFDGRGASGALTQTTASSAIISGHFVDPADFCVVVIHDADDVFSHLRLKYLPNFDFAGHTLSFDLAYSNLQPIDSPKFPTIDWPFLDLILEDGSTAQVPLFHHAVHVGGSFTPATASVAISAATPLAGDTVSLWLQNVTFEYTAVGSETAATAATALAASINAADWNTLLPLHALRALAVGASIELTAARYGRVNVSGTAVSFASGERFGGLQPGDPITIDGANVTISAIASADSLTIDSSLGTRSNVAYTAPRGGRDGNMLRLPTLASAPSRLNATPNPVTFSGGSSDATWHIALDFSALGYTRIRQAFFTFAPPLADSAALSRTEYSASITNWALSGPDTTLPVAIPSSRTVHHNDFDASYSGVWSDQAGFFTFGFSKHTSTPGNSVTVLYTSQNQHDLYLGTSLYSDRGKVSISIDGGAPITIDCYLNNEPPVITRRLIQANVAAGTHSVVITLLSTKSSASSGFNFLFDYLQAAVPGQVPDPDVTLTNLSAAHDYDTEVSGFQQSPQRLMFQMDKLGFAGQGNEYIGVFFWNERRRIGATIPAATISFSGLTSGDAVFINISGSLATKSVFPADTNATVAAHLAYFLNEVFSGVWAEAAGNVLTIHSRATTSAFNFTLSVTVEGSGSATVSGSLSGSVEGTWIIDDTIDPPINSGASAWHADYFAEWAARSLEVTTALSMELVDPPDNDPASTLVFSARYPDGTKVSTATGRGTLNSTHCAPLADFAPYIRRCYLQLAQLQIAASLPIRLQFGENLWWFFTNFAASNPAGGMAFHDAATSAAALTALGRTLHIFTGPDDDPAINSSADANFLASRLDEHLRSIRAFVRGIESSAQFELLFPYDVNHVPPAGAFLLGGRLNRHINFPAAWAVPSSAPFNYLKTEGLDNGAGSRSLTLAKDTIDFPVSAGNAWPRSATRHLIAVFNGGCPWQREYRLAKSRQVPVIIYWAFDQFCLFSWPPGAPPEDRLSQII